MFLPKRNSGRRWHAAAAFAAGCRALVGPAARLLAAFVIAVPLDCRGRPSSSQIAAFLGQTSLWVRVSALLVSRNFPCVEGTAHSAGFASAAEFSFTPVGRW